MSLEGSTTPAQHAPLDATAEPVTLPASFAQELLWLMHRTAPDSVAYNVPRLRRLRGALDVSALQRTLDALVARHEILRTTYGSHGEQVFQAVHAHRAVPFEVVDVSNAPAADRGAAAERAARERMNRPFDLSRDVLLRATLIRLAPDDHVLLLESHHIAFDGWSRDILFRELDTAYRAFVAGAAPSFPDLPIQYADFAIWQREHLSGDRMRDLLGYWRTALEGASLTLDLPLDRPRPPRPGFDGATTTLQLDPAFVDALSERARAHGATLYMMLLAAYMTVLHRYSGQDDILVGSPVGGRSRPETEQLIGYFANTVVQRGRFANDPSFADVLASVRESSLGAYDHQDVPFERLVLELGGARDAARSPVFQVVFTQMGVADEESGQPKLGDLTVEGFAVDAGATKFDITLLFSQRPTGVTLLLRYRTDLFTHAFAERFEHHLRAVLDAALADPRVRVSAIPLLTTAEREALAAFNATQIDEGVATTVTALFETQAKRGGNRLAVVGPRASATAAGSVAGTLTLTYTELDNRANQLAHHLRSLGVAANTPVGLLLDREVDALVGLMGILKAGGAYMPLAVEAPAARLAQQITESGARVVVTNAAGAGKLPVSVTAVALDRDAGVLGALPPARPDVTNAPSDLAYVLFTSGSTGTPKGVAVTHANAVHYARAISRVLADVPADQSDDGFAALDGLRFAMPSTLAADLGNTSLLPALLAGGTLHLLSKDVTTDPARFAEYVGVHQFDVLKITPNHFAALTGGKTGAALGALMPKRWLVLGGEALRVDLARSFIAANTARVLNHYGPTETTVGVCTFEVTSQSLAAVEALGAATVPIGAPLANTHAYVVDAHGNEQPLAVPGELFLGGAGVARGYLKRDDLTAERFVEFHGERVYRTGDRVRRLANGAIEFLGRADDQVKVRGFRVELGEIEQVLRRHPGVAQGVVVLRTDDASNEARLLAYAVPKEAGYAVSHSDRPTSEKLIEWFAAQLPDYMVPSAVVLLDALPLTPNGKVDTARLPAADGLMEAVDRYVAPVTPTETQLAQIWSEVLKRDRVGRTDNFLSLGGHSLLAIRVLGKISKTFGVRLPLRTLFDAPTVEQLAQRVDDEARLAALESMSDEDAERLLGGDGTT
jgi:amino acid adenylation domain-containing protein